MAACPCGNPADYLQCCGRYHAGAYYLQAPTPEAEGFVEFVARNRPPGGGRAQRLEELSRFRRDATTGERWQYVDAVEG